MLIKYTITITWFLTDSHTKVTSPRTSKKKAAQNLKLPFHTNTPLWRMHLPLSLIFCAARVFWCDWKQILTRCSYKKLWKPTASTLSLRHGRTTNRKRTANLGGRPKGHRATCINLDLHDNERRWKWKRSKLLGTTQLRKTSNSTANAFVTVIRFVLSSVVQHLLNEEQIPFSFVFFGF